MPPDIAKLLRTGKFHIDELSRQGNMSKQWLLENRNKSGDHPIYKHNRLQFYVCASEAFPKIVKDILAAKSSVDLILWGFDPGMEVSDRQGKNWPRGQLYGDLLTQVASKGVTVRMLVWCSEGQILGRIGRGGANNLFGYTDEGKKKKGAPSRERQLYCEQWWKKAMKGRFANLHVRHRDPAAKDVGANIEGDTKGYTPGELGGMKAIASHHQKPILIDYEIPEIAVGYVMGLNSTTDCWDTPKHIYDDPRRGHFWEGTVDENNPTLSLKPYRDYAIRVKGSTLHCLNRNFVAAWDRAKTDWDPKPSDIGSLAFVRDGIKPEQFTIPKKAKAHIAQIVRTQPEERDKTVQEAYWLATSQARNYLYVENQYFQYTAWSEHLKAMRQLYLKGMQAAGVKPPIPDLYVFILTPEPERPQFVPRTYDTIAELGQAHAADGTATFPAYEKAVQERREGNVQAGDRWYAKAGKILDKANPATIVDRNIINADIEQSAMRAPVSAADLEMMGIQVLVAKLYTQGEKGKCREIYMHSKLLVIDDVFFTLGSANLNLRSMAGDSEINIACMDAKLPKEIRQRVWGNVAGEDLNGDKKSMKQTHGDWIRKMLNNADAIKNAGSITDFIVTFSDNRGGTGATGIRLAQAPAVSTTEVANA
ncbi:phospholipase D-like domain-containing protein [Collimonas silvisoli]|uniref:phospholipase D-like domain-containing protein n=1 Tax=Collimonas silvisoli TaxID=2825884 RepID=UPI001B8D6CF6|nr:phospholipase D-like domain-containing protein [Collimonas silvisoli]